MLAGTTTVAAANAYPKTTHVGEHNARLAVAAEQAGSAFVAAPGMELAEILCHQEGRQVGNGNTVVLERARLQIPPSPLPAHYVRAKVKVRRHQDGSHAVFHGPRRVGRYDAVGTALAAAAAQAA